MYILCYVTLSLTTLLLKLAILSESKHELLDEVRIEGLECNLKICHQGWPTFSSRSVWVRTSGCNQLSLLFPGQAILRFEHSYKLLHVTAPPCWAQCGLRISSKKVVDLQQYALIYLTSSGTQLCLYLWVYNFLTNLRRFPWFSWFPRSKFVANRSKGLWVMIGNWSINSWMYVRGIHKQLGETLK